MSLPSPSVGGASSILMIGRDVPATGRDAGAARQWALLERLLADGHAVTLIARDGDAPGRHAAALELEALGVPVLGADVDLDALLTRLRPDLVWLSRFDVVEACEPALRRGAPGAKIVLDVVEVLHPRLTRAAAAPGADPRIAALARQTREREVAAYAAVDELIAAGEEDAAALRELAPGVPVRVLVDGAEPIALPTRFVAPRDLDDAALRALLDSYVTTFAPDADASLVLPVTDGAAANALLRRLLALLAAAGHDPERIPDVALTPWPAGAPAPRGAIAVDGPERWGSSDAEPAPFAAERWAPSDPEPVPSVPAPHAAVLVDRPERWESSDAELVPSVPAPRAAVAVRLPADPADAALQLAAVAAATPLPAGVELLLLTDDPAAMLDGARIVPVSAGTGRRAAQLRAVHATVAPILVVVEPHALPEPGFVEPLIAAVEAGAAFAGPAIDGQHGLRVASDGSLWPLGPDAADAPEALAFDVLAATRETWLALPHVLLMSEGMAEAQLGAWARPRGGVAVPAASVVRRRPVPPQTVVICTRNRAEELPDAIALLVAYGAAEIVISDSASTDDTPAVTVALAAAHPGVVRVVRNEEPGASRARNAAAAVATHELILAMDDDSRPAPGWLEGLTRELARPGVANVGGPVAALWPDTRAAGWPGSGLDRFHSACERTDADETLPEHDVPYGNNWGVRRSALLAIGGFDTRFGPAPGSAVNGEESLVTHRLRRGGHGAIRFVAAATTGHRISADRVADGFVRHRSMCVGVERARINEALDGLDEQRFLQDAQAAAVRLVERVPLRGDLRLEDVMDAIAASGLTLDEAAVAADAAGELAGALLLTGRTEAALGADLVVRFDPQHLKGVLRVPAAA